MSADPLGVEAMIETIRAAWKWTGLEPCEIVATNGFGNLIVRDVAGAFWRICPEELSCAVIASDASEYERLAVDPEFSADWEMAALVEAAIERLGQNPPERCFCLQIPAVLGGEYSPSNVGSIARQELIAFAGDLAEQIKDHADGSRLKLSIQWPTPN